MKKILITFALLIFIPINVSAKEENMDVVAETTKYYKTIENKSNQLMKSIPIAIEVSKEEYDSYNLDLYNYNSTNSTTETNYKKMTTSILSNGNRYRYKVVLEWKNMPSTRSYDTIGIGFLASVKVASNLVFSNYYCYTAGNCKTDYIYSYNYQGENGAGVTFKLPSASISSMKQTLYFDVEKNTSYTIVRQSAYGDYAHATKNITVDNAQKYNVTTSGINFNSSVVSYYDEINVSRADWNGTW